MKNNYKILLVLFFIAFQSHSQSHEVGIWQFRSIGDSDINNFLSNEKNVYSKVAKKAVSEGKISIRKVRGPLDLCREIYADNS